uniref:Ribosome biogenesis protein NOP53 n=1 Tax=Heterorhabditis bacteriophora TaxID=37862 RepID=A0A1I7WM58_HETBA
MSDARNKHAKLQSLLNRRRKVEGAEPSSSTISQDDNNSINREEDPEIIQATSGSISTDQKRIKAKEAILWDIKRAKERAEKYGPQGWLRPKSLNTNKQFLHRTLFLRASKALRKPLTTIGWARPELPSGYGKVMARKRQKAPEAVQHLSAERFRSVQNYSTLLPKGRWEKSTEAKPRLKKALKN